MFRNAVLAAALGLAFSAGSLAAQSGQGTDPDTILPASPPKAGSVVTAPDPTLSRSDPSATPKPDGPGPDTTLNRHLPPGAPSGSKANPFDPDLQLIPFLPPVRSLGSISSKLNAISTEDEPETGAPAPGLEPEIDPTLHRSAHFKGGTTSQIAGGEDLQQGAPVPEPETWALFLLGLSLLGYTAWKRGLLDEYLARAPESR